MIESVPLIQDANDAQQINASIIAMKKASKELDEKILKLNNLNKELDKKIAVLDNGLNKEIEDRKEAINALDVASVGGSGKYISAISETNGKISATVGDLTSVIESGNNQPATSGGVADAIQGVISLPTDAVLHYSFDDVPDYPDGTAVYFRNKNFTSADNWRCGAGTVEYVNGVVKITTTGNTYLYRSVNFSNCVVKIKLKTSVAEEMSLYATGSSDRLTFVSKANQEQELIFYFSGTCTAIGLTNVTQGNIVEISQIYIGDGSYSTPIIDNANGQNNATNNGGIAVQGVSGKGAYFPNATQNALIPVVKLPAPTSDSNITISLWIKFDTDYPIDEMPTTSIVRIGQFQGLFGLCKGGGSIIFYARDSSVTRYASTPIEVGKWHNIVVVYNGTTHQGMLYDNGVLKGSSAPNIANFQFGSNIANWYIWGNTVIIGVGTASVNKKATIDDLLIFDRALSDTEVQALYLNKANTPKYFPTPTNEIKQNSLELITSGGVYSDLFGENIASSVFTVTASWIANHTTDIRRLGAFLVCNIFVQVMTAQTLSSATKIATLSIKPPSNIRALGAVESTGEVIKAEINPQGELTVAPFSGSVSVSGYIRFESIIFAIATS